MQGDYMQQGSSPLALGKIFKDLWRKVTEMLSHLLDMQEMSEYLESLLTRWVKLRSTLQQLQH